VRQVEVVEVKEIRIGRGYRVVSEGKLALLTLLAVVGMVLLVKEVLMRSEAS